MQANDPVSKLFNIIDSRIMVLGSTIIDTDDAAGYSSAMKASPKSYDWSAKKALGIYPGMKLVQEEEKDNNFGMLAVWNNGFIPIPKGTFKADNMLKRSSEFLNNSGYITTDQFFKIRTESKLNSVFSAMKWYSASDKTTTRLIDESLATFDDTKNVISSGMICEKWAKDPISIKYLIKGSGSSDGDVTDYVYLIGGSRDLLEDDMLSICNKIKSLYLESKSLMEENDKNKSSTASDSKTMKFSNIQSSNGVWLAYDEASVKESDFSDDQLKIMEGMRMRRKLIRMIQGVIYIRNYLVYANSLSFDNILEFNADSKNITTNVKITDIIKKYEIPYQYCKNLINMYPDIAGSSW